jgi:hypothetical protein
MTYSYRSGKFLECVKWIVAFLGSVLVIKVVKRSMVTIKGLMENRSVTSPCGFEISATNEYRHGI